MLTPFFDAIAYLSMTPEQRPILQVDPDMDCNIYKDQNELSKSLFCAYFIGITKIATKSGIISLKLFKHDSMKPSKYIVSCLNNLQFTICKFKM